MKSSEVTRAPAAQMSKQTQSGPKADAAKMRRAYLWVSTETRGLGFFGSVIAVLSVLTSATLIYIFARLLLNAGDLADISTCVLFLLLSVSLGPLGVKLWQLTSKRAKTMPYVPPVADQIAALPAEDILVRGSGQPAAASGELLRAAQVGGTSDATELLRANV